MRHVTMAAVIGEATTGYLAAAEVLGRPDDPVADCLRADARFDLTALRPFHDLLAAHYRHSLLEGSALQAEGWISGHVGRWMLWAEVEALNWSRRRPRLLRALMLVVVQPGTTQGVVAEWELWDEAVRAYPVPGARPTRP